MTEPGDVVLVDMRGAGEVDAKLRPALVLSRLPGSQQTLLVCGISTRIRDAVPDWDEIIEPTDPRFALMGLKRRSAIRLSFLAALVEPDVLGRIGALPTVDLHTLTTRLAKALSARVAGRGGRARGNQARGRQPRRDA